MAQKDIMLVSDVHGKMGDLYTIIRKNQDKLIIILGDVGFKREYAQLFKFMEEFPDLFVLMGNHDYYTQEVMDHPNVLYGWGYWTEYDLFWVSGAESPDRHSRTQGLDWFAAEELPISVLDESVGAAYALAPGRIITHICPSQVQNLYKQYPSNRTGQAFDGLFDLHQPDLWVYGHYHRNRLAQIGKTTFVCLDELNTLDI